MKLLSSVWGPFLGGRAAWGLLALRVVGGLAMAQHGWGKVPNAMHWMDQMPGAAPAVFQGLAAYSEFLGGLALALGLFSPLAAFMVASTMVVAVKFHLGAGHPWVGMEHSYEPALGYLSWALALLLAGPGRWSLDALWVPKLAGPPQD